MKRVLVVGGAGVFGCRLVEGLRRSSDAEILVAGRSHGVKLDRDTASAADVAALRPDIVIDASGPFQNSSLRLVEAALAAGAHYLDLADARDFVARIGEADAAARNAQRVALAGASSTPALSHAVLDEMCAGWTRIDVIRAGIAPGNRAPRGRSVIEAALQWTGAPLRVFEDGAWCERAGWSDCGLIAVKGLGRRRFALAEVPDLDLFALRFAPRESALFVAALELSLLHRGLSVVSWLRRNELWREPAKAAGVFAFLARLTEMFGSDRGGMIVDAVGRDADDKPCRARWTLIAPAGQGPYVPTLPALALTRALLAGALFEAGARACVGALRLADLDADFAHHGITTSMEREMLVGPFERALGVEFERAPVAVKRAHRLGPVSRFSGEAEVEGPVNPLGAIVAWVNGFPKAAESVAVRVVKTLGDGGVETWRRDFAGSKFRSRLRYLRPGFVEETFGALTFEMKVWANERELGMEVVGWRIGPLRLPAFLAPRSNAVESEDSEGRYHFDVPIALPMLGRVTHYRGYLVADAP